MRFMPHTESDVAAMLKVVGAGSLEDLIAHVPAELRATAAIALERGRTEAEVSREISALAAMNAGARDFTSFLGGGYYRHYVPAAVRAVIARAEFATSYTPYQAEASQGTTQAIFEFQTLIAQLTAMEVANASMYDGASAAAEAVLMAHRLQPKRRIVAMSRGLWPDYRATIRTYLSALGEVEIVELPFDPASGTTSTTALEAIANDHLLCTVIGYPNAFGIVEPLGALTAIAHRAGAIAISATAEGLALGLLKPPGDLDIDIAVGEGQSFGLPLQFGGPGFGFLAAHMVNVRQMPGRLVGQTHDRDGRRAFTLTLATREQHIRRERATSNICTNHSLCALAATVYLSLMGRTGLRDLAERNVELAHQAADTLTASGLKPLFNAPFFNEFVINVDGAAAALRAAEQHGILAGLALGHDYPELAGSILVSVTEMNDGDDFSRLAGALAEVR
ncbi:MAG TPA: aminomethyl-transferring glycine dehydrogenase subunit GcvPA [Candidatus Binataceae bacterium]|nr:aminomethyl-transferring glycine dehydrogenase subunit GcvPA [Candidatus Binataceae bacterium]